MRAKTPFGTLMSTHYDPNHYRFQRSHTGQAPEPTAAISGYGIEIARLVAVSALVAAVWLLLVTLS